MGYRIKRADPAIRLAYARVYRACLRLFFGLRVRDVDCACKLFRREALEGIRLDSGGAFLSAELLIKLRATRPDAWSRWACRTIRGPPAARRAPTRGSCCARCATSGGCASRSGLRRDRALATGEPALGTAEG